MYEGRILFMMIECRTTVVVFLLLYSTNNLPFNVTQFFSLSSSKSLLKLILIRCQPGQAAEKYIRIYDACPDKN